MSFTSTAFLLFLLVTVTLYYLCPVKWQNLILLVMGWVFYAWQHPATLIILILSATIAYCAALALSRHPGSKLPPAITCCCLFGMLFVYKYLQYSINLLWSLTGSTDPIVLNLLVPIGVSFYSFALTGYVFDVYRGKLEAERNYLRFLLFAGYFPSVLSGPINRARELLPQLRVPRRFDLAEIKAGLLRFVIGAAKKLVVANMLGTIVDTMYADIPGYSSVMWILAVALYSIEIYLDFSAYSDMAIGISRMFGITLQENFLAPYLSASVKSFWKKWHISLTSWFREYLYFPLGGSRKGTLRTRCNILIVFAVSGIWHGAGLTFLIWGLLNGLYQVLGDITLPSRKKLLSRLRVSENNPALLVLRVVITFALISVAWIFFRADTAADAVFIIKRCLLVFRNGFGGFTTILEYNSQRAVLILGLLLCAAEDTLIAHGKRDVLYHSTLRYWLLLALLVSATLLFGQYGSGYDAREFIYFQF